MVLIMVGTGTPEAARTTLHSGLDPLHHAHAVEAGWQNASMLPLIFNDRSCSMLYVSLYSAPKILFY